MLRLSEHPESDRDQIGPQGLGEIVLRLGEVFDQGAPKPANEGKRVGSLTVSGPAFSAASRSSMECSNALRSMARASLGRSSMTSA